MAAMIKTYGALAGAPTRTKVLNLKYFNFALFGMIAALGVFYLVNLSQLAVLGFTLNELKSEATILSGLKLSKEEAVNRARSYQALASRTQNLNMVAVGEMEYLVVNAPAVAKR